MVSGLPKLQPKFFKLVYKDNINKISVSKMAE